MSLSSRFGALAALALALLAIAGCGDTIVDLSKTEDQIKANVEHTQHEKVDSVDCPDDVAVEPKAKFSCTVHLSDGGTAKANLEIRDEDANLNFLSLQPAK